MKRYFSESLFTSTIQFELYILTGCNEAKLPILHKLSKLFYFPKGDFCALCS